MLTLEVDGKTRKQLVAELLTSPKTAMWPKEMATMKRLLEMYPDPDFFFFIAKKHRFTSLINLLASKPLMYQMEIEYRKSLINKEPEKPKLEEEKQGDDVKTTKTSQTLMDFMKK